MEAVRKILDASQLTSVISLPETFKNRKLEVIVFPVEEAADSEWEREKIEMVVDSLTGSVPNAGLELEEYRDKRLAEKLKSDFVDE